MNPKKLIKKKIYSKTDARYNLPKLIDRVRDGEGPIYITDRGTTKAILVSYADYEKSSKPLKKGKKFSEWGLIGIWKDREDVKDSVAWVQKLRQKEDDRSKESWTKKYDDK